MSTNLSNVNDLNSSMPSTSDQAMKNPARNENSGQETLSLRMVRGPLKPHENQSILSQYNELASANIPEQEFLRWIQDSPAGPAWHAVLETRDGEIVGHTSLIPFRATHEGRALVAAKSEYSFIREEFRSSKIRGFEHTGRLKNLIYIDELFRQCRSEGWSPLLISTPSGFHRVFRSIACYPVKFPLWECLLVLRPLAAGTKTPNLRRWQRVSVLGAGLVQTALWSPALFFPRTNGVRSSLPQEGPFSQTERSLSFFHDKETLAWRYPEGQYERIASEREGGADLIVKYGSADRYLRVCQWRLDSGPPSAGIIARLVRMARKQQALGVRWAVYGEDPRSAELVGRLRNLGFLCARRVRSLLIHSADEAFLDASAWNLTDAMFSFDL
jgi:hypothetical protein